jgi:type IX secretion system PorP/SprF family membrane protein
MKNMPRPSLAIVCLFLFHGLQAQQRMQYSQFLQNGFLLNPSLCGIESYNDVRVGYAKQWNGFEGPAGTFFTYQHHIGSDSVAAPATSLDLPMRGRLKPMDAKPATGDADTANPRFKQGWGIQVFNEGDDIISNSELSFAYAAHFLTAKKFYVSGGFTFGFRQNRFNPEGIRILNQNDMVFAGGIRNIYLPVINLGFSVYNRNWFASYSSMQVFLGLYFDFDSWS